MIRYFTIGLVQNVNYSISRENLREVLIACLNLHADLVQNLTYLSYAGGFFFFSFGAPYTI